MNYGKRLLMLLLTREAGSRLPVSTAGGDVETRLHGPDSI